MSYEELSHTGDLQYRVTGFSIEELFSESARALFSTITDLNAIDATTERAVEVEGKTAEELLIEFLRACLALFNSEEFVAKECTVSLRNTSHLRASLQGECFDPKRHPFLTEIKAMTYHDASVKRVAKEPAPRSSAKLAQQSEVGWEAVFTLDL